MLATLAEAVSSRSRIQDAKVPRGNFKFNVPFCQWLQILRHAAMSRLPPTEFKFLSSVEFRGAAMIMFVDWDICSAFTYL